MENTQKSKPTYHRATSTNNKKYLERTKRNQYWLGGKVGQEKIKKLRIAVAGLGGMGSNIAEIFIRLGVGSLKIADFDIIESSNINRQVIANSNTVGVNKAIASANELRNIADDFELTTYEDGIHERNVEEFVSGVDVVIDEIDVYALDKHVLLHKAARKRSIPVYSAYVVGLGVHLYKFGSSGYSLEDFLLNDEQQYSNPSAQFLIDRYGHPFPKYLSENKQLLDGYIDCIDKGDAPIFGASCYLGQSLLTMRVIIDLLSLNEKFNVPRTPEMPNFLILDPLDLNLKTVSMNNSKITTQPESTVAENQSSH